MTVAELFVLFKIVPETKDAENALDRFRKSVTRMATAFVGLSAGKAFAGMIEGAAAAGTHIQALSKQFGISTQAVQEWGFVAKNSGSNMNEFGVAISQIERNLRLFSQGHGSREVRRTFEQFGLSQADAAKMMTSPNGLNQALFKISDRMKEMGSSMDSASGITVIAGRRAKGFAADMSQGSEALRAQIDHLHAIGGVLGDEKLASLKAANSAIIDIKTSFSALWMSAVATWGPRLVEMLQSAERWFERNRVTLEKIVGGALKAFGVALTIVGDVIEGVGDAISAAFDGNTGAIALLSGLATLVIGTVIPALWAMVVPWVIMLAPLLEVALAVAAVVAIVALLIKYGPQIQEAIGKAFDWIADKAEGFAEWWSDLPGVIWDAITDAAKSIEGKFGEAFDAVIQKARDAWETIKSIGIFGPIGDLVGAVQDHLSGPQGGAFAGMKKVLANGKLDVGVGGPRTNASGGTQYNATINSQPTIVVKSPKEAAETKAAIENEHLQNHFRQAASGLGGNVQ